MKFFQTQAIRLEWGEEGILQYYDSEVFIICDILSFSTSVDISLNNATKVFPAVNNTELSDIPALQAFPSAIIAGRRGTGFSLSPRSLLNLPPDCELILPSPNGSALTLKAASSEKSFIIAACFRNFKTVAEFVNDKFRLITLIAAGERWQNGSIRFATEDYLGAGAVISQLRGEKSAEAKLAESAFLSVDTDEMVKKSVSGQELIQRGYEADVALALEFNSSHNLPVFINDSYQKL